MKGKGATKRDISGRNCTLSWMRFAGQFVPRAKLGPGDMADRSRARLLADGGCGAAYQGAGFWIDVRPSIQGWLQGFVRGSV